MAPEAADTDHMGALLLNGDAQWDLWCGRVLASGRDLRVSMYPQRDNRASGAGGFPSREPCTLNCSKPLGLWPLPKDNTVTCGSESVPGVHPSERKRDCLEPSYNGVR